MKFRNFNEMLQVPEFAEAVAIVAKQPGGLDTLALMKKIIDHLAETANKTAKQSVQDVIANFVDNFDPSDFSRESHHE